MVTLIFRAWRLFATAMLFAIFGIGGIVAQCVFLPALYLFVWRRSARRQLARGFIRWSFRSFLGLMSLLQVCGFDIDKATAKTLAQSSGCLVVANHPTLLDVLILLSRIKRANCVVKNALWYNPFVCFVLRTARYISNRDVAELMDASESALHVGDALVVFPEATRTVPGQPMQLQRGAANIAVRAGVHVQIVHIDCHPVILSKRMPWYSVPAVKPCFTVRAGVSLQQSDFIHSGDPTSIAARRLTEVLKKELSKGAVPDGNARVRAQAASH